MTIYRTLIIVVVTLGSIMIYCCIRSISRYPNLEKTYSINKPSWREEDACVEAIKWHHHLNTMYWPKGFPLSEKSIKEQKEYQDFAVQREHEACSKL